MPPCLAVLKGEIIYKSCNNYSRIGCHTCSSHSRFSFPQNNYNHHPNPFRYMHIRRVGVRKNIEEWIRLGLVEIPPKAISLLSNEGKERWAYFWMICARHNKIRPEWNPKLHLEVIGQLFTWWNGVTIGPFVITSADILPLICVKGSCGLFYQGLLMFPSRLVSEEAVMYLLLAVMHLRPEWFLEFWMTGWPACEAELLSKSHNPVARILEGEKVQRWFADKKREFYQRRLVFGEELLAVTHHPSRFMDWTMDWKEKGELEARWNLSS